LLGKKRRKKRKRRKRKRNGSSFLAIVITTSWGASRESECPLLHRCVFKAEKKLRQ
jgi:hypothetical protein